MKRWHIVSTRRTQTLAEHSFNVAQIAVFLGKRLGVPQEWHGKIALEAIDHDIDEVLTGDAPTPAKGHSPDRYKGMLTPELIVKMADVIEAYAFIKANKIDRHGEEVHLYAAGRFENMVSTRAQWEWEIIRSVLTDITEGEYTI